MLSRVEMDVCQYFGQQEFFQRSSRWAQETNWAPVPADVLTLPGFRIGMIIALCHFSGICQVEIDRLKMLVR